MKVEWKSCFKVGVSIFFLYLAINYWKSFMDCVGIFLSAAAPLFLGAIVAYIINIMMSFYEKYYFPKSKKPEVIKSRRPVCMIAAFVTLFMLVIFIIRLVVPELVNCVQLLITRIPGVINTTAKWLDEKELLSADMVASLQGIDWKSKIEGIIAGLTTGIGIVMDTAISVLSVVVSGVVTALLAFIFAIYILLGKETLGKQLKKVMNRYIKKSVYKKMEYILSVTDECFHNYIVGQCTEAVILGVLCTIGMLILRLPYAVMIGAVIAFTALIPVAGAYIGGAVGFVLIVTVSPVKAIVFIIYLNVLQQLEGNLIYPRVVGSSLGLPAIWVLAAVTVGGGVMGILGMLLGVPLAAVLYRLLRADVNKGVASY